MDRYNSPAKPALFLSRHPRTVRKLQGRQVRAVSDMACDCAGLLHRLGNTETIQEGEQTGNLSIYCASNTFQVHLGANRKGGQ